MTRSRLSTSRSLPAVKMTHLNARTQRADVSVVRGEAPGLILDAPQGSGGFGYDPLFFDEELGKTFAEIAPEEKDARSHRGKAFRALAVRLG